MPGPTPPPHTFRSTLHPWPLRTLYVTRFRFIQKVTRFILYRKTNICLTYLVLMLVNLGEEDLPLRKFSVTHISSDPCWIYGDFSSSTQQPQTLFAWVTAKLPTGGVPRWNHGKGWRNEQIAVLSTKPVTPTRFLCSTTLQTKKYHNLYRGTPVLHMQKKNSPPWKIVQAVNALHKVFLSLSFALFASLSLSLRMLSLQPLCKITHIPSVRTILFLFNK